jgi:hypothetical protein
MFAQGPKNRNYAIEGHKLLFVNSSKSICRDIYYVSREIPPSFVGGEV